jgi:UDP-N-acetylglucosamine acyltransferase
MANIHPTALVDPNVQLGDDVSIGAYAIVKGPVQIGAGTIIHEQSNVQGTTVIGSGCKIGPAAFVGLPPQHLKADPNIGQLIIGDEVTIRESATVHRATHGGADHATRIGNRCFIMGGVHIAHDCVLDDDVIIANSVLMGGHCHIATRAFLGGGCTLHQFLRVGRLAVIGGNEAPAKDIPPFAAMRYGGLKGYNAVGCKRSGMSLQSIHAVRSAYHCLHSHRNVATAVAAMFDRLGYSGEVREIIDFISTSKRGILPSLSARLTRSRDFIDVASNEDGE